MSLNKALPGRLPASANAVRIVIWLAVALGAAPASSQSYERIAHEAATAVAATAPGSMVLVEDFTNEGDGTVCAPLSGSLRRPLIQAFGENRAVTVLSPQASGAVSGSLVARGSYSADLRSGIFVTLRVARGSEVIYEGSGRAGLPRSGTPEADCIYVLQPDGEIYEVRTSPLVPVDAPNRNGRALQLRPFDVGQRIRIEYWLRGTPWKIVSYENLEYFFDGGRVRAFLEARLGMDIAPIEAD